MYIEQITAVILLAICWFAAKYHYQGEAKKDFDYKFKEIAGMDLIELREKIAGCRKACEVNLGRDIGFARDHVVSKDIDGSWYIKYRDMEQYYLTLRSNGWTKDRAEVS